MGAGRPDRRSEYLPGRQGQFPWPAQKVFFMCQIVEEGCSPEPEALIQESLYDMGCIFHVLSI